MKSLDVKKGVWDDSTQTFHGGQDWKFLSNFTDDFSVTTNGLGTPLKALDAAREAVGTIHHYPPADFQPALTHLVEFLWPDESPETQTSLMNLVLLGNGASELIDLVIRSVRRGGWRPGPTQTQYKEYERSALADDRPFLSPEDADNAVLTCMVNPTNPTGDYMDVETIKKYIASSAKPGSTIIVDESMQPWLGEHWRKDSLIHQRDWVSEMSKTKKVDVWVMTSWTKIWSCTGIRLGSVIAPSAEHAKTIKRKQVPWSVNSMALAFLSEVVKDDEYMRETWRVTPLWRLNLVEEIARRFPSWKVFGAPFLSWVWVDTGKEDTCSQAVALAKEAGVPVRSGLPGYNCPTYVRIAVRKPEATEVLLKAWHSLYEDV